MGFIQHNKKTKFEVLTMQFEFEKIERLVNLSKQQFDLDLTNEILGLIQVYSIEKYSLSSTISIFRTHCKIQNDITKSNAVEGYDVLLTNLEKEVKVSDPYIFQINIVTENKGYLFFTDLELKTLLGVLKMNKQKVDAKIELKENDQLRGYWTNRKFFLNGKELN